jgi:hypothetical protein
MRYRSDRGDSVSSNVLELGDVFRVDANCEPAVVADELLLKSLLSRGYDDRVENFRGN